MTTRELFEMLQDDNKALYYNANNIFNGSFEYWITDIYDFKIFVNNEIDKQYQNSMLNTNNITIDIKNGCNYYAIFNVNGMTLDLPIVNL